MFLFYFTYIDAFRWFERANLWFIVVGVYQQDIDVGYWWTFRGVNG